MAFVAKGENLSDACNSAEYTTDKQLGEHGGLINILSKSIINRKQYTEQAIITSLFDFINQDNQNNLPATKRKP
eukprot:UN21438